MLMKEHIEERVRLHKLLNSEDCPENIDEQYKKLYSNKIISEQTSLIFKREDINFSPHDAILDKIKFNNKGFLEINFYAFVYDKTKEIGKQEINLIITPAKIEKINAKKNDIIFTCVLDKEQIGLITLNKKTWQHQIDIFNYKNIEIKFKGNIEDFKPKKKFKM